MNGDVPASDQLREEIHAVIRRYGEESDVSVYQTLGVIEIVKADLIEMLTSSNERRMGAALHCYQCDKVIPVDMPHVKVDGGRVQCQTCARREEHGFQP